MIQSLLEILHTNVGISWLPTLMIATVSLRLLALPAYVKMRSFTARTNNHMPEQVYHCFVANFFCEWHFVIRVF